MKTHNTRMRALRRLTIAGCFAALALPAGAGAMVPGPHPLHAVSDAQSAPDESGARLDHRGLNDGSRTYVLPSNFKSDVPAIAQAPNAGSRTFAPPSDYKPDVIPTVVHPSGAGRFALPAGFKTDVQSSPRSTAPSSSPSSITHEVRTVIDNGSRTLPIVLASLALGIALCGTGYAVARLARIQRRIAGSSS